MSSDKHLSIGEVVRLTGLTERTLRFYEERGLVRPIRSANGRRAYDAQDLMRISHIVLLKQVGFSLSRIRELVQASEINAVTLIDVQIQALEQESSNIVEAVQLLRAVRSELDEGKDIDTNSLCEFIRIGEQKMTTDTWQSIYDKYYTPEEQENWKAAKTRLSEEVDQDDYARKWSDLSDRIEKALPIEPASDEALEFVQEWNALLEPFLRVADDQMKAGASRLWNHMDEWSGQVQSPIPKKVWEFMSAAMQAQKQE